MIKFKKLENLLSKNKDNNNIKEVSLLTKNSRTWEIDSEYNYGIASKDLRRILSLPQSERGDVFNSYVEQYGKNVWVYAAVYQIAMSLASVPLNLYKKGKTKNSKKIIYDKSNDPLVKLLKRPNPFMSQFDLKEAIGASLELTGNAYIEKVLDKNGNFEKELYVLQPHKIFIIPDKKQKIAGFVYSSNSEQIYFNKDEIIHLSYYNPTSDFYGVSPIKPSEININTNNYAKKWNFQFFKNSALPKGILYTDGFLDKNSIKRIRDSWKAIHNSVNKAHEVAILEGGLKWQDIGMTRKDMDFVSLIEKDRGEILAAFGVYEALLGIVENINNSSLENLKKLFWENTMLPKIEKIESALNFYLVYPYDDSLYVSFDKDSIEALKGSQETRARIAAILVDRGIFTQNEVREKFFNLPPVEWGDTWYMPLNLTKIDKEGSGIGIGNSGEGDKVPGRTIGRPSVTQEDIVKFLTLSEMYGIEIKNKEEILKNIDLN